MMASNPPVENGAILGPPHHKPKDGDCLVPETGTLEDTLQQMKALMKENRELKEALKQTSTTMKERFEGLSAWKEKQKEERNFLEEKLGEAKERVTVLTKRNEELRKRIQALEGAVGGEEGDTGHLGLELEALKAQMARLQAEKDDLVAMNSELQLKNRPGSPEDSFIEIRIAKGEVNVTKDSTAGRKDSTSSDPTLCWQKSEELTVSQLLQSLRKETQKVEKLELELQAARAWISEMEPDAVKQVEVETQTSLAGAGGKMERPATVPQAQGEAPQETPRMESDPGLVDLKGQVTKLFQDLQQAQTQLDDAEDMKKSLQDRFRDLEQEVTMLRTQLTEKQQVQTENRQLRLQLESVQTSVQVEQKNAEDERSNVSQMKEEYIKLLEHHNALKQELKIKEQVQAENEKLMLQMESMQTTVKIEHKKAEDEKSNVSQVKEEYIKLLEHHNALKQELKIKEQVQAENEKLMLQMESMQTTVKIEHKKAEDEKNNMARVKDEYTKLYEDYNALKQDMKKKEPPMSKEDLKELQARLDSAEKALAVKQQKIDDMKQEIFKKEQELETISVFQAQAEVYSSDFYAERAAREKIHEEKERLATQLEFVKKQNSQLQEEMESMGRQSLNEMQRRHEIQRGAGPRGGGLLHGLLGSRGAVSRDWEQQHDIPEHACPKCNEILPDLDSLQIHIMDCII